MHSKRLLLPSPVLLVLAASLVFSACGGSRRVITAKGIHGIVLGAEMPAAGARRHKGYAMRDSLAEEAEFTWRVATLKAKGGPVYVESDFMDQEQINRIRIETPALHLRNGLAVGMEVADLLAAATDWAVVPLRAYRLFDFYSPKFPAVHFIVDDPAHPMDEEDWQKYRAEAFSSTAKIAAIVVY